MNLAALPRPRHRDEGRDPTWATTGRSSRGLAPRGLEAAPRKRHQSPRTHAGRPVDSTQAQGGPRRPHANKEMTRTHKGRWQSTGKAPGAETGHRTGVPTAGRPLALLTPLPSEARARSRDGKQAPTPRARSHSWRLGQGSQAPAHPQPTQQGGPTEGQGLSRPRAPGGKDPAHSAPGSTACLSLPNNGGRGPRSTGWHRGGQGSRLHSQ